jgi:hypothetical protein
MNFLPQLMADITRHPRNIVRAGVDFEWSDKCWTHNVFRVYELIFGARSGVRPSVISAYIDGQQYQYACTFEASCALIESSVRRFFTLPKFAPIRIYIPKLATPNGFFIPASPFLLAIAFDTATQGEATAATSVTWSHTNSGSNLTLGIGGEIRKDGTVLISGATYNSVSATVIDHRFITGDGGIDTASLYLPSPATGTNNIVLTSNEASSTNVTGLAVSLTGTAASPLGAHDKATGTTGTSASQAITTESANSVNVSLHYSGSGGAAPSSTGTNQTNRYVFHSSQGDYFSIGTQTTTTVGSYTSSWSQASANYGILVFEIKEVSAGSTVYPRRALLGVGS